MRRVRLHRSAAIATLQPNRAVARPCRVDAARQGIGAGVAVRIARLGDARQTRAARRGGRDAGVAAERIAQVREGTARLLSLRPSARAIRAASGSLRTALDGETQGTR